MTFLLGAPCINLLTYLLVTYLLGTTAVRTTVVGTTAVRLVVYTERKVMFWPHSVHFSILFVECTCVLYVPLLLCMCVITLDAFVATRFCQLSAHQRVSVLLISR